MRLSPQCGGAMRRIYALVLDNGRCPAVEFLDQLKRINQGDHRTLVRRYFDHAERGPSPNSKHSEKLRGYQHVYEFKAKQRAGSRLTYFELSGDRTVLATGFQKGPTKRNRNEYDRADRLAAQYIQEERDAARQR